MSIKSLLLLTQDIASNSQNSRQISPGGEILHLLMTLGIDDCGHGGREGLLGLLSSGIPENHLIIHNAKPGRANPSSVSILH